MVAYIKDSFSWDTKDIVEFEDYSFSTDIEYSGKSTIKAIREPNISDDDIVICKDGAETMFIGVCESITASDDAVYTITLLQKERFFDRKIILGNEALIKSTGIEDFIASEITANWISSGDSMMDKDYLTVTAVTHTRVNASVPVEDGIYNLKTYIGNACENYGIFLDFVYADSGLTVRVLNLASLIGSADPVPLDVTSSDVVKYKEVLDVDVIAKLVVRWNHGGTVTIKKYYLKTDRSITENASDPDRAAGVIDTVYIEKDTEAEMYQEVLNAFKSNSYSHKISFDLYLGSLAYPPGAYFPGRPAMIKTKTGIKSSLVTGKTVSSGSGFASLVFGKLKVSLIDKLRKGNA